MKQLLPILFIPIFLFGVEYTLEDYNTSSPTYGQSVWLPEYQDYITLHYFSSQG